MKIVTVMGARPQFIKAAVVSHALQNRGGVQEILIHTGQHYDVNMSKVFFDELEIPEPRYNLGIGSDSHGVQTARMLEGIEELLCKKNQTGCLYMEIRILLWPVPWQRPSYTYGLCMWRQDCVFQSEDAGGN